MSQENTLLPLISRDDEERYLRSTLEVVNANTENYSRQVAQMQAEIDDMLEHYHDNDMESLTDLNNTVTLHEHMKMALERNMRAQAKPYFGRIIFRDLAQGKQESLYIGRGGISRDTIHPVVIDWRAPIANAYYESGLGECSYTAPGGEDMRIDLQLKRTYEIENGTLKDYFDSEVIANDELLTRYLAKNKQAVLGEIVATIQKEQNEIIRLTPYRNLIVQGVAGSGKTTVAMHRISYILYNYAERFRPEDFYIVGSNRILLNYITGVLPELDVTGVRQMTMAQLFTRLLYEEWDEKKYRVTAAVRDQLRGKLSWFEELKAFCDRLEWDYVPRKDVCLDTAQSGNVNQRSDERVLLLSQDTIESYLRQNPSLSLQSKIDGLNERLTAQIHNHFLAHMGKYTEDERKEILRVFRGWFGGRKIKLPILSLYDRFLTEQRSKGAAVTSPPELAVSGSDSSRSAAGSADPRPASRRTIRRVTEFDVYDLAALAYLYARIQETQVISEAHHVVIDEAQDFGMMAYAVLFHCIRGCTYTIMGDVSQNIHFGSGLNDWEELKALLLRDPADSFRILKKSYRNTVEISEYALRILRHGSFSVYPVEPIIRHGKPVQEIKIEPPGRTRTGSEEERKRIRSHMIRRAAKVLKEWQSEGYTTMAVICRDTKKAACAAKELGEYIPVCGDDLENAVFSEGIMVLPVEYTKGLEFDAVLLLDPTREEYPVDDGHAKLLYVAATRALHELCVLYSGELTGLITEEPLTNVSEYQDDARQTSGAFQKKTKAEPTTLFFASGKSLQMPDSYDAEHILRKARQTGPDASQQPGAQSPAPRTAPRPGPENPQPASARPSTQSTPSQSRSGATISRQTPGSSVSRLQHVSGLSDPKSGIVSLSPGHSGTTSRMTAANLTSRTPQSKPASSRPRFGDIPPGESLQPPGHSKIDLAVRWVSRQSDGLCLQSRYGVLRLSPVNSRIIRISFARLGQLEAAPHPGIAVRQMDKAWMYREIGGAVELLTDELCLHVDKSTGAVQYMTRDRKPLLAEQPKDCRQLEDNGASLSAWLYLCFGKKEALTAVDAGPAPAAEEAVPAGIPLRQSACVISRDDPSMPYPLIVSDRGYALMPAAGSPVVFCDLPAYGSYIRITKCAQMDLYFLLGGEKECLSSYRYLCGR